MKFSILSLNSLPLIIAILILLLIFLFIILLLTKFEKKLHKSLSTKEEERTSILREIEGLKETKKSLQTKLTSLDRFAKEFLQKTFNLVPGAGYSRMAVYFKRRQKYQIERFCRKMMETIYSGDELIERKINELTLEIEEIVKRESKVSLEEKPAISIIIAKFNKRIKICEIYKKKIVDYMQQIKNKCFNHEINHFEYARLLSEKRNNRTLQEWLNFYDYYIRYYRIRIMRLEKLRKEAKGEVKSNDLPKGKSPPEGQRRPERTDSNPRSDLP